jgi:hypothetical protein
MKTLNTLFLALLLSGCTMVGHQRVEGWPELAVTVHRTDAKGVRDACAAFTPWYADVMACAHWDLRARTCVVYIAHESMLEHEMLHCKGYDHVGGQTMRRAVERL